MASSMSRFIRAGERLDPAIVATVATDHGFTAEELEERCDPADRWEIFRSAEALAAFALSLRESDQIARGERPSRFTYVATCKRCGPVFVPEFLAGHTMIGCRWCAARERGIAIPQPDITPPVHVDSASR